MLSLGRYGVAYNKRGIRVCVLNRFTDRLNHAPDLFVRPLLSQRYQSHNLELGCGGSRKERQKTEQSSLVSLALSGAFRDKFRVREWTPAVPGRRKFKVVFSVVHI